MRKIVLSSALVVAVLLPASAFAQGSTAAGAVGGAAVGAVVGGPVGAVIGGTVGAVAGAAAEPPGEVVTYVRREQAPSVVVRERVAVGEPIPQAVELRRIPTHSEWNYAVVNNQRVIVDAKTRKVVKVVD